MRDLGRARAAARPGLAVCRNRRFRRGDERLLERVLELRPAKRLHHVADCPEPLAFPARVVDRYTEDRELGKQRLRHGRAAHPERGRFQEQQVRLFAFDPLAGADRGVAEPHAKELEQRPRRGVWIHNEDGRHMQVGP